MVRKIIELKFGKFNIINNFRIYIKEVPDKLKEKIKLNLK